ncbi:hypothetical protein ElyMa_007026000 [Elysia marginata]|uniref:Uncharacterized protein n=1 Tax=Elysia marginata TaxID=1093978 RepID=A0AAV4JRR8_9GAST|nr:hypothetical protein ElyMa_007026000 [Elysia marginata]
MRDTAFQMSTAELGRRTSVERPRFILGVSKNLYKTYKISHTCRVAAETSEHILQICQNYRTLGREVWSSPLQTCRPNSGKTLKSWKRPPASSIIHEEGLNMLNMRSRRSPSRLVGWLNFNVSFQLQDYIRDGAWDN